MSETKLIAFAKEVLHAAFERSAVECDDLYEMGVRHGLLAKTTYDPKKHGPNDVDAEPGDPWFAFAGPLVKK